MLKDIRQEIRMLDVFSRAIFYQPGPYRYNALRSLIWGGLGAYFGLFFTITVGIGLIYFLIVAAMIVLPSVSVLHPLYGARQDVSWRNDWDLRYEGQYYRALPREDKSLYPYNITKIITDPDLTNEQAKKIDGEMESLRKSIEDRNRQRRLAVKKHLDIDYLLEDMKESRASVQIETDTYKELM